VTSISSDMWDNEVSADEFIDMNDPVDAALAQRAETITAEPEATAVEAEPVAEDRPRNPDGTFAAKAEPEPEPDPEDLPIAAETPEERLYADRFKTDAELERAYKELQSKFGEQGNELGQYRQWYEQQQAQQRPASPPGQLDVEAIQGHLYENQHEIIPTIQQTHNAALGGDQQARLVRNAAIATLRELNAVAAEQVSQQVIRDEFARDQQLVSSADQQRQQKWDTALDGYAKQNPDITKFTPQMMEVAEQLPADMVRLLESQDPATVTGVLDYIYTKAQAGQVRQTADNLAQSAQQIATDEARKAELAVAEASVVSATQTVQEPKLSEADRIAASWDAMDEPMRNGWNI
jgi:hypothetical protein